MTEDQEAQENELLALASIYDEEEFRRAESAQGGEIQLCLELPPDFKVVVKGEKTTEHNVCFLPPLMLNFELPSDYPSTSPPVFTLSSKWITKAQLSTLCHHLDELWEENQGFEILFMWIQFLKEETLEFLGIKSPLEIIGKKKATGEQRKTDHLAAKVYSKVEQTNYVDAKIVPLARPSSGAGPLPLRQSCQTGSKPTKSMLNYSGGAQCTNRSEKPKEKKTEVSKEKSKQHSSSSYKLDPRAVVLMDPHSDPLAQLLDFDEAQRQRVFDGKTFLCGICFGDKLGSNCLCFNECQHVYCKACLTGYFEIQIQDGNVQCLNCPEPKCASVATPSQVKQLVDEDLFARYDRLLLQSSLDLMADVVYCPRLSCGTAVMVEPDTTMGICSACQYAFCTLCKLGYHGVSHCKITADDLRNLRDEYLSATAEGQKFMEQRFGKRVVQKAVEESFSRDWLTENCKCCPRCGTNIQKVDGCNKMTCTSCKQYFCWLCLGALSKVNPYSHFNNIHSPCFNRLFLGVDVDEDDFWSDEED